MFFFLQINRLYLLLTVKESAINVPPNLEARRRITFFANSLFMNMPSAPKVRDMLSFRSAIAGHQISDILLLANLKQGLGGAIFLLKIYNVSILKISLTAISGACYFNWVITKIFDLFKIHLRFSFPIKYSNDQLMCFCILYHMNRSL